MAPTTKLGAAVVFAVAGLAGGCSTDAEDDVSVSSDLVQVADGLSQRVTVFPDRLELPAEGGESAFSFTAGRILAGGPREGDEVASAANPYGFLRRVKSVTQRGDVIVIDTDQAKLTDALTGNAEIINVDRKINPTDPTGGAGIGPQSWTSGLAKRIGLTVGQTILKQHLTPVLSPVKNSGQSWNVDASIARGYMDFAPGVSTSLKLSGGRLQQMSVFATGTIDAEIAMRLDVNAQGTLETVRTNEGWTAPQHVDMRLFRFPRQRWFQVVGILPVWEALEVSLVLRCDMAFKGEVHGVVGLHANGFVGAGGEYTSEAGLHALRQGPTVTMTPIWEMEAEQGSIDVKCSLAPEVALYIYDLVGPTAQFGPYLNLHIDRTPAGSTWLLQPGMRGDFGGRLDLFGWEIINERIPIFDLPIGTPWSGRST